MSWEATSGLMRSRAQHGPRAVHPAEARFVGEHDAQAGDHAWRQPAGLSSQHLENRFF